MPNCVSPIFHKVVLSSELVLPQNILMTAAYGSLWMLRLCELDHNR